jgi:probable selenium-dependent hydroxylase accessory protein YqeC
VSEPQLPELLSALEGIVCAVGAGGKKTVLRAIAAQHQGRVALTGTVPFLPPQEACPGAIIEAPETDLLDQLRRAGPPRCITYGLPKVKQGRLGGVPAALIRQLHDEFGFDLTLVKADGARMRWVKGPAEDEPVLPAGTATVIPVFSARALGEPLADRIAHRPALLAAITGCRPGEPFMPEHAARLLTSEAGLLRGCGHSTVRPVINMVDDEERLALARRAAELALGSTTRFDQVLLTRLKGAIQVVGIVTR